jgi:hypothetical protein
MLPSLTRGRRASRRARGNSSVENRRTGISSDGAVILAPSVASGSFMAHLIHRRRIWDKTITVRLRVTQVTDDCETWKLLTVVADPLSGNCRTLQHAPRIAADFAFGPAGVRLSPRRRLGTALSCPSYRHCTQNSDLRSCELEDTLMLRYILVGIVTVSVLARLALVPTSASAQSMSVLPTFHPSTIQMPRTMNQPTYGTTYSVPSVKWGAPGSRLDAALVRGPRRLRRWRARLSWKLASRRGIAAGSSVALQTGVPRTRRMLCGLQPASSRAATAPAASSGLK